MKNYLLALVAISMLQACKPTASTKEKAPTEALSEAAIYNQQSVANFLQNHPEQDAAANAAFMQAIDAYRNKKDIDGALGLFKKSLMQRPSAKAYYELGNASMDARNYPQAMAAYRMAEQLGFEPLSKLLYNMACTHSRMQHPDSALAYLEYAMEAGYTNAEQIMKDRDLEAARRADNFQAIYLATMSGSSDPETVAWLSFKRGFTQASFPLVLNQETAVDEERSISYDFEKFVPEMKGERFSREVGKEFYYLTKVEDRPEYTALIYAVKNSMMGEEAPTAYLMVSFSPKGKLIDKMVAGGQSDPGQPYKVATIQQSGQIEIKEYEQVYEQDPSEHGYAENKIISSDLKKTVRYRIKEDGHFESDDRIVGMR